MDESNYGNKLKGAVGVIFGLVFLSSLLIIDKSKLIIPVSNLFLVRYFIVICIINAALWLIIAGALFLMGSLDPANAKDKAEYKEIKAKRVLLNAVLISPFFISFFTTIFVLSAGILWKVLGGGALVYVAWSVYSNIRVLMSKGK